MMLDPITLGLFVLGFVFLVKGADFLIDGASALAKRFGVSTFFIGLTVVAFGTSVPELAVSINAGLQGNTDIILGNILGSNIANILLILGTIAVIVPVFVERRIVRKELPISLLAILVLAFLANDGFFSGGVSEIDRIDGIILIAFFVLFMYYVFSVAKKGKSKEEVEETAKVILHKDSKLKSVLLIVAGLVGVTLGSEWIVNGAIDIASFLGVGETLIGLTIIAIGTSIPELAASLMALKKKVVDMAVGNIVGSNIFNIFWVLGLSAIISPIAFEPARNVEVGMVVFATLIMFAFLLGKGKIMGKSYELKRWHGSNFLMFYILFILFSIIAGTSFFLFN